MSKKVALLIPSAQFGEEEVRLGIYRFARPNHPWDFLNLDIGGYESARRWKPDGAIARAGRIDFAAAAKSLMIPFVNLYGGKANFGLAQVGTDNEAIGTLAADYLADLGFKRFGYFGLPNDPSSNDRSAAFSRQLMKRGFGVELLDYTARYRDAGIEAPVRDIFQPVLTNWLAQLPRPIAIFVFDDARALLAAETCRRLKIQVPEEVALLGTGDCKVLCYEAFPPLSSIRLPLEQEGYKAAELLARLMKGDKPPEKPILLQPGGVTPRQSTDVLAITDRHMANALRFIRENSCKGIEVDEVARHAGLNRRYLERKFREMLQRSPFQEIRRVQLERAKELLAQTDFTIDAVAEQTGFGSRTRLTVEFSKHTGASPGTYRRTSRIH